jgi:hypothetical protein
LEFDRGGNSAEVRVALCVASRKFIEVMGLCVSHPSYAGETVGRIALDDTAAVTTFRVIYALSWFGLGQEARHVLQQMSLIAKITGRWSTADIKSWAKALFYIGCDEGWESNPGANIVRSN